ncbi:hypothetical protein HK107_10260 [Parvularcula sp. ZS-1/3]|uniref:Serine protease n=1 Tax=Parvularcula mediterranea TaxID=2732508 RepID=A0A7Y3W5J9_9PROT|nr:hypothetical protein [Parvularcula mediterranea]NNU16704.1 hypothetical protein [Parvularcula mediterranea]
MSNTGRTPSAGMTALRANESERLALLRQIGEARGSLVLTYITSFREGWKSMVLSEDVRIIERHAAQARRDGIKKLDLYLSTWGGDATVPWALHAMLRDYLPKTKIGMILPFESYSAGTGIALGGDEVVMGLSSVLGPVDTQAGGYFWQSEPTGGGVSALKGFLDMLSDLDLKGKLDDKQTIDWLTRNANPLMLGEVYRVFRENKRKILKILGSRQKPLSDKENERIADFFLYGIGIHSQGVRRREAEEAGVSFITKLEDTNIERPVEELFELYSDVMQLFTPFARRSPRGGGGGFNGDVNLKGEHASETPVVMIESLYETNAAYRGYGVDRSWSPLSPDAEGRSTGSSPKAEAPAAALSWTSGERPRSRRR